MSDVYTDNSKVIENLQKELEKERNLNAEIKARFVKCNTCTDEMKSKCLMFNENLCEGERCEENDDKIKVAKDIIKKLINNAPDTYSGTDVELNQSKMFAFQNAVNEGMDFLKVEQILSKPGQVFSSDRGLGEIVEGGTKYELEPLEIPLKTICEMVENGTWEGSLEQEEIEYNVEHKLYPVKQLKQYSELLAKIKEKSCH